MSREGRTTDTFISKGGKFRDTETINRGQNNNIVSVETPDPRDTNRYIIQRKQRQDARDIQAQMRESQYYLALANYGLTLENHHHILLPSSYQRTNDGALSQEKADVLFEEMIPAQQVLEHKVSQVTTNEKKEILKKFVADVVDALTTLQNVGWVHNDIKLESFLYKNGEYFLSDPNYPAPLKDSSSDINDVKNFKRLLRIALEICGLISGAVTLPEEVRNRMNNLLFRNPQKDFKKIQEEFIDIITLIQ